MNNHSSKRYRPVVLLLVVLATVGLLSAFLSLTGHATPEAGLGQLAGSEATGHTASDDETAMLLI